MAGWWNPERTPSCSRSAVSTRSCTGCSSVPRRTLAERLQASWYAPALPPWPLRGLARPFGLVVQQLSERGLKPGVVLRGYGGSAAAARVSQLVAPDSDVAVVGDEALLLRLRTGVPVAIGRDRVGAARRLLATGVNVI